MGQSPDIPDEGPGTVRQVSTPPRLDLPCVARAVELSTPRGPLAALEAVPAAREPASTVLLVPGYTGSKEDFLGLLEPLTEAGYRVVALDQIGQADSPHAEDPAHYDMSSLAQDVLAVARELPGPVDLVGHSFGGLVSRAAVLADATADADPRVPAATFRSLTLLCSGPGAIPAPPADRVRLIAAALPLVDLETIWVGKRALDLEAGAAEGAPAVEAYLRARFLANCPTGLLRMAEQLLTEPDRTEELAGLSLPIHVVYGQHDDAWPPALQADMARRLRARETVLPGLGHSPAAEDPLATAAVLASFFEDIAAVRDDTGATSASA